MARKSRNISRWVRRNQNKHLCGCGCGEYIVVTRDHAKPSVGIPKFIKGHNFKHVPEEQQVVDEKESLWDKLSPEEKDRRLSQLKSFGKGEENPSWRGGRRIDENGYVQILTPGHPFANDGYVAEHRLVVEERERADNPESDFLVTIAGVSYLKPSTVVHHIDEVKTNNESSNLMLLENQAAHSFIHHSPLPMEERLRRIALGIYHSRNLDEESK